MQGKKRKLLIAVIAAVAIAALLIVWVLAIVPAQAKGQSYQGQVVQTIAQPRWGHGQDDRQPRCYLVIRTDDNKHIRVRVPLDVYDDFKENDRVVKREGERWPQPAERLERHIEAGEFFDYLKESGREQ